MNLIKNEPKIIKELREDERLGLLKSSAQIYHKESVFEEKSDYTVLDDKFFSNEKNLDLIETTFEHNRTNKKIVQEKGSFLDYFKIFENSNDIVIYLDADGKIIDVNKKIESMLGYKPIEVIGKNITKLDFIITKDFLKPVKLFRRAILSDDPIVLFELDLQHKNGNKIPVEINTNILKEKGKIKGTLALIRDISNRKKMEKMLIEREQKFRMLAEQNLMGLVILQDDKIKYVNQATSDVIGYSTKELYKWKKREFYKVIHPEDLPFVKKQADKKQRGDTKDVVNRYSCRIIRKNKDVRWIDHHSKTISYEGKNADFITLVDITDRILSEEQLIESKSHFQSLFNILVDPVVIVDSKGKFLEITDKVEEITGFEKKELLGKNFLKTDIVTAKSKAILMKNLIKRMTGKNIDPYEIEVNTKDGKKIPFEINAEKIEYQGKPADMIIFRDITSRKKAEQGLILEKKQLLSLFDSIDELIYVVDPKSYEILFANKFLQETFKEEKTQNICYKAIYNKNVPCEFCTNKIILEKKGEPYRWEYHNSTSKKDYSITDQIIIWPDGRDVKFSLAVDVTKLKMALNELKDAHEILFSVNQGLERKVKERTIEIERLVEQKDEFIKQLSHDLKTPLTPMMILVPILQKKIKNAKDQELLEIIMRNINFMKDLVTKTIDLAKLSSGKISFRIENTNLLKAINNIIENGIIFDKKKIKIKNKVDRNIIIKADKLRLDELLSNLISNSIKYTPEKGGQITIDANEVKDSVTVSIMDSGIGMTADEIKHVFDEFYKVDDSRHNLDSSGLGLAISKRIVEKHGGDIWVESLGKGKGSTFYFTLQSGKTNN